MSPLIARRPAHYVVAVQETPPPWHVRLLRRAVRAVLRAIGRGIAWVVALTVVALGALVKAVTVGRWRGHAAPFWLALAATVVRVWPAWATVAVGASLLPWLNGWRQERAERRERPMGRRFLSDREAWLCCGTTGAVAFWHLTVAALAPAARLGWWWFPGLLVLLAAPVWWRGRRVFPRAVPAIVQAWATEVAGHPKAGHLAGTEIVDYDAIEETPAGPEGDALVLLPAGVRPSQVATMDEVAESLLGMHPGTVTLARSPRLTSRYVRVRFSPQGDAGRLRFFDGPTLTDADWRFVGGAAGTNVIRPRMLRPGGACFYATVSSPGGGKGGFQRLAMTEAALHPGILPIFLDGKQGGGNPGLAAGMGFYARTPEQWRDAMHAVLTIMRMREARYGLEGRSRFAVRPGDPAILTWADEWKWIIQRWPGLVGEAYELTGKGRSLGMGFGASLQKGDAASWGDAGLRGNVYGNGTTWLGSTGDVAAAGVAAQDFLVDLGSIPPEPGWGYWLSKSDGEMEEAGKYRVLYIPDRADVEDGMDAPFGTVEEWMREATVPALHSAEQEVLDRLMGGDPELSEEAEEAAHEGERADRSTKRDAILELLRQPEHEEGMLRGAIAKEVGANPSTVSDLLKRLKEEGLVSQEAEFSEWKAVR